MHHRANAKWAGISTIAGALGFIAILVPLHLAQTGYDPAYQLMSELALGQYGWAMLFAFLSLGAAILAILPGIATRDASPLLMIVLAAAAVCFLGAGLFPLGHNSEIHIAMMAGAFVLIGLAMVMFPAKAGRFAPRIFRITSRTLAGAMALCLALGHNLIPAGLAQRLAALCLISWLLLIGWKLIRH